VSSIPKLPRDFLWGAATAAYQIEGAADQGGRGPSVWDRFCEKPGKIWEGHSGRKACDHYHQYRGDLARMRKLGLKAYRFSVSWTRILPAGRGRGSHHGKHSFRRRLVFNIGSFYD